MDQRGQTLPFLAGVFVLAIVIFSLVVDGMLYFADRHAAQVNLDAACTAAAHGTNFETALMRNWDYSGWDFSTWPGENRTLRSDLGGPHDFYLAQFMGIRQMSVYVMSRCTVPLTAVLPICVKEPDVINGLDTGTEYPILGQGVEALESRGSSFSGACVPQIWCQNTDCEPKLFFEPATESNSPNVFKDLWSDTVIGAANSPLVPIGGRLPVLDGVSNKFEAKTIQDNFIIGDEIILMVYSGIIDAPEPSFGNWENVEVIFYVRARITDWDANTVYAEFIQRLDSLSQVEDLTTSRTVPWDWAGPVGP